MFDIANNTEFLTATGINDAPEDVKAKLIDSAEELAEKLLTSKIMGRITEQQAAEFDLILDDKEAVDWLNQHIPELPTLTKEVLAEVQDEIVSQRINILGR